MHSEGSFGFCWNKSTKVFALNFTSCFLRVKYWGSEFLCWPIGRRLQHSGGNISAFFSFQVCVG